MQLTRLFYISAANINGRLATVTDILDTARRFNSANGLTGILTYDGELFTQVLEGPFTVINQLMARIKIDERHSRVRVLSREPVQSRLFTEWSMAYIYDIEFNDAGAQLFNTSFPAQDDIDGFIESVRSHRQLSIKT